MEVVEVKPSEQPEATKKPSTPQQNLTGNAESNVKINHQDTSSNNDSPIPGLPVIDHGPYAGSNGNGVSDDRDQDLTEEQLWDPDMDVYKYLGGN